MNKKNFKEWKGMNKKIMNEKSKNRRIKEWKIHEKNVWKNETLCERRKKNE